MLIQIHRYDESMKYVSSENFLIEFGSSIPENSTTASPFPIPEGKEAFFESVNGSWIYKDPQVVIIPVTDVVVSGATKVGNIWWVPVGTTWTLTASIPLPDSQMMVILERIVDGRTSVDDVRFVASIVNGQLTINGKFTISGNFTISADRLNRGLERIGMPIRLSFSMVEFDAYVVV